MKKIKLLLITSFLIISCGGGYGGSGSAGSGGGYCGGGGSVSNIDGNLPNQIEGVESQ
jgi:hypothetical protein